MLEIQDEVIFFDNLISAQCTVQKMSKLLRFSIKVSNISQNIQNITCFPILRGRGMDKFQWGNSVQPKCEIKSALRSYFWNNSIKQEIRNKSKISPVHNFSSYLQKKLSLPRFPYVMKLCFWLVERDGKIDGPGLSPPPTLMVFPRPTDKDKTMSSYSQSFLKPADDS